MLIIDPTSLHLILVLLESALHRKGLEAGKQYFPDSLSAGTG